MSFYEPGWRAGDSGGETPWTDSWVGGGYAQQLKGVGNADPEYAKRFASLTKGESSVDDDGEWRTVTSLDNREAGTREEMQRLASEWKAKGYDVRVQDLDDSHGATWADLAVRKGQGQAMETESAPHEPSQELLDARGKWDQYEARRGEGSIHYNPTSGRAPGVVDGVGAAANYGNDATDDYHNRFIQHLNAEANLIAKEQGHSAGEHLDRFEGAVPDLASGDIKDLYDYYSKKITA
jgi:hypothetical protein